MVETQKLFKGIKQIKGFNEDGTLKDLSSLDKNTLYFIRTSENKEEGFLYLNGKKYGANSIDCGEY